MDLPNDADTKNEVDSIERHAVSMRVYASAMEQLVQHTLLNSGGYNSTLIYSKDVYTIVDLVTGMAATERGIDLTIALRLLLAAAWRFAVASVKGAEQLYNPKSETGPDDPVEV